MKKIWIDYFLNKKNKTGVAIYTDNLITMLNNDRYLTELFTFKFLEKFHKLKFKAVFYFIWLNTFFYIKTLLGKPNIILCTKNIMPFFKVKDVRYISTIHDIGVEHNHAGISQISVYICKFFNYIIAKRADIILTVSESSKKEILKKYSFLSADKIKITYNTIPQHFSCIPQNDCQKFELKNHQYILAVGEMRKNKNIKSLIEAFNLIKDNHPDIKLVLVGDIHRDSSFLDNDCRNIIFTGYVDNTELVTLYKNAMFYVFPSIYEGFGIPIIEAQFVGCPVLCSNIEVFKEIANDSAEFCEPTAKGISSKLEELIKDEKRRKELSVTGLENVKRFSVDVVSDQLEYIIKNV